MKNSIIFWLVICIASSIIIFLNYYSFNKNEDYIFRRNYKDNNYFKEIKHSEIDLGNADGSKISGKYLLSYKIESLGNKNIFVKGEKINISSGETRNFEAKLPDRPANFVGDKLYFIQKYRLGYSLHNKIEFINIENLKVFYICPISNNKLLLVGELNKNGIFTTGFYIYDESNSNLISSKILKTSKHSTANKNVLIYQGNFSKNFEGISYNFLSVSKIFIFNLDGTFNKEIDTKESVPIPKLAEKQIGKNKEDTMYVYMRGKTFATNIGSFRIKDTLFALSYRVNQTDDFLTIDRYIISDNEYNSSLKLNYNNKNNRDLLYVSQNKESIFLVFIDSVLSLKIDN